jgi:methionyl aminopeptidase
LAFAESSAALYHIAPLASIVIWKFMSVSLKTDEEIAKMRVAGKLAADVLMMIGDFVKAGVTTEELDRKRCHDYIVNVQHAIPAPLNYRGFPKSICTSVNHVVCHGIPTDKKSLKKWRHY